MIVSRVGSSVGYITGAAFSRNIPPGLERPIPIGCALNKEHVTSPIGARKRHSPAARRIEGHTRWESVVARFDPAVEFARQAGLQGSRHCVFEDQRAGFIPARPPRVLIISRRGRLRPPSPWAALTEQVPSPNGVATIGRLHHDSLKNVGLAKNNNTKSKNYRYFTATMSSSSLTPSPSSNDAKESS